MSLAKNAESNILRNGIERGKTTLQYHFGVHQGLLLVLHKLVGTFLSSACMELPFVPRILIIEENGEW